MTTNMWIDDVPRPDHGLGWRQRSCSTCGAGWVGHVDDGDDWCPWCEHAQERQLADARRMLLDPPWLRSDAGSPRYDGLSEIDKAVWDRTRGQTRGAGSVTSWIDRLVGAVKAGLITKADAERAIERQEQRHG